MDTFLAILVLTTLALIATSPRFYRLRRIPAMSVLMSGGWLAVGAGVLLGPEGVDLISRESLRNATPLLMMALGWIGFVIGLQARREVLRSVLRETARLVAVDVVASILFFGAAAWFILMRWTGHDEAVWLIGPAGLLAAAAIGWSMESRSLLRERSARAQHVALLLRAAGTLCSIVAILWFGVLYEIPTRTPAGLEINWVLSAQRLGLAIALAGVMGAIGLLAFRRAGREREQQLVVSLGIVVFVAGLATELGASPLLASMLTGVVIANISGKEFQRFERFIIQAEHVVAVLLALIAGLLMKVQIEAWGAVLIAALILLRIVVKPLALRVGAGAEEAGSSTAEVRMLRIAAPVRQNPLALALAVGVVLAEPSDFHRQLLTIVILSGCLLDFVPVGLALLPRFRPAARTEEARS